MNLSQNRTLWLSFKKSIEFHYSQEFFSSKSISQNGVEFLFHNPVEFATLGWKICDQVNFDQLNCWTIFETRLNFVSVAFYSCSIVMDIDNNIH